MDIKISSLSKSFGAKKVLDSFNAVIPEKKTTVFMGRSGGGKTTLMNIMLGLVKPDSGEIRNVPTKKAAVFQEDRLLEGFDVYANIRFVTGVTEERAEECLEKLGIGSELKTKVSSLSGGMRRRAAIARALLSDYELLVLDEPFKGLDGETKERTMEFVKSSTVGKTMLLVTHDEDEAAFFGGNVIEIG